MDKAFLKKVGQNIKNFGKKRKFPNLNSLLKLIAPHLQLQKLRQEQTQLLQDFILFQKF